MTLPSTVCRVSYTGTGSIATYAIPYKFLSGSDLSVWTITAGVATLLTLSVNYTVTGVGVSTGGTLTLNAGNLTTGVGLVIYRAPAYVQGTSLGAQSGYSPQSVEVALDYLTMLTQELNDGLGRALVFPPQETPGNLVSQLPAAALRVSQYLFFDVSGNAIATATQPPATTPLAAINIVQGVFNVASLKAYALPLGDKQLIRTAGYYTLNDGGGALYEWNASDTRADDGGSVIQLNAGGTGRFNLIVPNFWVDILQFGVTKGAANNATAINNAFATGYNVRVQAGGPYKTGPLTMNFNNQQFYLEEGATVQLVNGSNATLLTINGSNSVVAGRGTLDGNSGNQSAGDIIDGIVTGLTVQDVTLINAYRSAIVATQPTGLTVRGITVNTTGSLGIECAGNGSNIVIADNYITATLDYGIYILNTAVNKSVLIRGNSIDRSAIPAGSIVDGGIQVVCDTIAHTLGGVTISDNRISLPLLASSGGCVGISALSGVQNAQISGNSVIGGYTGVQLSDTLNTGVVGNSIYGVNQGVVIQGGTDIVVSGNSIASGATSSYGVLVTLDAAPAGASRVLICSNEVRAFGIAQVASVGVAAAPQANVTIASNLLANVGASTGVGVLITYSTAYSVTGNNIYGASNAVGISLTNPGPATFGNVSGNAVYASSGNWLSLTTTLAMTLTNLVISGNSSDNAATPLNINLFSGSVLGSGCLITANVEGAAARSGVMGTYRLVTAAYTVVPGDYYIACDATAGSFAVSMPSNPIIGQQLMIFKTTAANTVTINATFNGVAAGSLGAQYTSLKMLYNGASWYSA